MSILLIVGAIVALYLFLKHRPEEVTTLCVPGFSGPSCEKSDFIGTYQWSTADYYTLSDGLQHRNGLAFRVYAPQAQAIVLHLKPEMGLDNSYSMMWERIRFVTCRPQSGGFWFYNIGSIGVNSEYYYEVISATGESTDHLLQDGKEASPLTSFHT